ncbi:MAG TPA: protein kinase family protein [Micromonosporaceae bacterium]
MPQVDEGQQAGEAPPAATFGAPVVGEILAERYELVEQINDDGLGRMIWRGVDVVLRRPVAVIVRYPGGESANGMLQAAVAASRVLHPNLAGVYDAIDETERAYVVREWVDGIPLRDLVAGGPLDPARAAAVGHAVASGVAAIHASGLVHGGIHPGTVLIADDGRVMLADMRAEPADRPDVDIRAIGGLLYFALTGHWPYAETADEAAHRPTRLPDAVRDSSGVIAAPRQIRAGIPSYLDDLIMDLLDAKVPAPAADILAAELSRFSTPDEDQHLYPSGALRFLDTDDDRPEPVPDTRRRVLAGVAGLVAVALAGLIIGVSVFSGGDGDVTGGPTAQPDGTPSASPSDDPSTGTPQQLTLTADQVRVIDPDSRRRDELGGIAAVVDGDLNEGWSTHSYDRNPRFGGLKRGMGILINLDEPRYLTSVQVVLSASGASAELRTGSADAPATSAGDNQILESYTRIGEPYERYDGSTMSFSDFDPDQRYQYLLFWITELPQDAPAKFKIGVQEIIVHGR